MTSPLERPYQFIIDDLTEEIAYWKEHGMDEVNPDAFDRLHVLLGAAEFRQKEEEERGNRKTMGESAEKDH